MPYPDEVLCTEDKELFDYSTNLLGIFLPEDNQIILIGEDKKYFYDYWDFEEEVKLPIFEQDFDINNERTCFFVPIGYLHQKIQLPLPCPPKNPGEVLIAYVAHTPTRSNFWHFSVRWKNEQSDAPFERYKGSAWQKRLCSTMKAALQEHIIVKTPAFAPLPIDVYMNNSHKID